MSRGAVADRPQTGYHRDKGVGFGESAVLGDARTG